MILLFLFLSLWIGLLLKTSYIIFGLLGIVFIVFVGKRFTKKLMGLCALFLSIGIGISFINIQYNKNEYKSIVIDSKENYYLLDSFGEKFYVYEKENDKEIGDIIYVKGSSSELDFITLESEFDFKEFLNNKGVYKRFYVTSEKYIFDNPIQPKKIKNNFLSNFDENTSEILGRILFSTSANSDEYNTLKDLNISRLLNASGIYIYLFLSFINGIFIRFFKEKTSDIITFVILSFYSIFTFPKFSVIRILIIKLLKIINKYKFDEKIKHLSIVGFTGLLFLFVDHYLAYQDAFILGYLISINNHLINPIFLNKKKVKRYLYRLVMMYFFFIPFEIKFNYSLNPLGYCLSIIMTPLFMLLGLVGFISFFKIPIYAVGNLLVKFLLLVLTPLSNFSLRIYGPELNGFLILIYYAIYYVFLYYIDIGFKPIYKYLKAISFSFLLLYFVPINNTITNEVSFINVGQGDCCLIRSGNDVALIDTGGLAYKDIAESSLIPYFKKHRIYDIDLVMITHSDNDHNGALNSLVKHFNVDKVITSKDSFPAQMGGLTFYNYNTYFDTSSDENERSLVIGFSLMNKDFLITGDAPISIEKKIMENNESIDCDILKVGHHGSYTSSSKDFIKYLSPDEAIISVGKNNIYKHPNDSVLAILKSCGIKIRRTDYEGTITYSNYKFL